MLIALIFACSLSAPQPIEADAVVLYVDGAEALRCEGSEVHVTDAAPQVMVSCSADTWVEWWGNADDAELGNLIVSHVDLDGIEWDANIDTERTDGWAIGYSGTIEYVLTWDVALH